MTIPKNFYVDFPDKLVEEIKESKIHALEIEIDWCYRQCEDLLNNGVKTIHFYIMTKAKAITSVLNKLNC